MGAPMATLAGDRDPEDVYVIVARSSEREGAQGPFLPRHSTYHGTPSAPGHGRRHDPSRRGRSNSRTRPFTRPRYSQFDRRYTDRSAPGLGKGLGSGSPKTQPQNQNQPKPKSSQCTQNLNHLNLVKHNKSLDKYFHPNNFNTLKTSTTSSSTSGSSRSVSIPSGTNEGVHASTALMAVLSKGRRRTVRNGIQELRDHDLALRHLCNTSTHTVKPGSHALLVTSNPSAFEDNGFNTFDTGVNAEVGWTAEGIRRTLQGSSPSVIVVAIEYRDDCLNHSELMDEVVSHCECSGSEFLVIDVADTERWSYFSIPMYPELGHGDVSYVTNSEDLALAFEGWCNGGFPYVPPKGMHDVFDNEFANWLIEYVTDQTAIALVSTSYPAWEDAEMEPLDSVEDVEDRAQMDPGEEAIQEDLELDEAEIPNLPIQEAERRAGWKKLPQRIRVAIRRLHRQFGHAPRKVLMNLLRAAKVDPQYLEGLRYHRCIECEETKPRRNAHTTSLPGAYVFNHTLGVDIFEILDASGTKYQVLNLVCLGTCFQLAEIVREGPGTPTSSKCLEAIQRRWITWAGHPSSMKCDRGLHNRGILAQYMGAHGVQVTHAPLETPEATGRVERHGGVLKAMVRKTAAQVQAHGWQQMQQVLDEACLVKNSLLRQGGYSPAQWVLGRAPRELPSILSEDGHADLGAIQDSIDPESAFALQHQCRAEAKKAFVQLDTSKRVQKALLRSAKPIPGEYRVGDVVTFRRTKAGKTTWSPASRIIGFEGREKEAVWLLCENVPVLASAQNIRPASDAEALAFDILHGKQVFPDEILGGQQNFDDVREPGAEDAAPIEEDEQALIPQAPAQEDQGGPPLPSILEEEDEPTRERSRSPPERRMHAATSSATSTSRRRPSVAEPEGERTPGGSRRPSTYDIQDDLPAQIRERLQNIRDSETARYVNDTDGALNATRAKPRAKFMAFMATRLTKDEMKDLPGTLNYFDCTPSIQKKIDESRKKEWLKYESFQAAIPVSGKIRHIALPSKWVDTVKNIHEQHTENFVPEFKSRLVSCGNFEADDGIRTDSPTSDLETHAMVCAFAACEGVPTQSSDIKNAYYQALPIDRIILMRQPRGGWCRSRGYAPGQSACLRSPRQWTWFLEASGQGRQGRWFEGEPHFSCVLLPHHEWQGGPASHHACRRLLMGVYGDWRCHHGSTLRAIRGRTT